jgi:hypothetical protein
MHMKHHRKSLVQNLDNKKSLCVLMGDGGQLENDAFIILYVWKHLNITIQKVSMTQNIICHSTRQVTRPVSILLWWSLIKCSSIFEMLINPCRWLCRVADSPLPCEQCLCGQICTLGNNIFHLHIFYVVLINFKLICCVDGKVDIYCITSSTSHLKPMKNKL